MGWCTHSNRFWCGLNVLKLQLFWGWQFLLHTHIPVAISSTDVGIFRCWCWHRNTRQWSVCNLMRCWCWDRGTWHWSFWNLLKWGLLCLNWCWFWCYWCLIRHHWCLHFQCGFIWSCRCDRLGWKWLWAAGNVDSVVWRSRGIVPWKNKTYHETDFSFL